MNSRPTAPQSKSNLVRRLLRFVVALEQAKRPPNRREAYHALVALECLQDGHYDQGEEAMLRIDNVAALPPEIATQRGPQDTATTLKLRGLLDSIAAGQ